MEIWKRLEIDNKYLVSSFGRIKSDKVYHHIKGRILTPCKDKDGYLYVRLWICNSYVKRYYIHRLVAEYFIGDRGCNVVDHKDHNRENNNVDNLSIVDKRVNAHRRIKKKNAQCKYIGVFINSKNSYSAAITYKYNKIRLGSYKTQKLAALAYNKKAIEYYGEYANINNVEI